MPLPKVGSFMKPTTSLPSFFCESGSAGVLFRAIDALPVLYSWMPWYRASDVASSFQNLLSCSSWSLIQCSWYFGSRQSSLPMKRLSASAALLRFWVSELISHHSPRNPSLTPPPSGM